MKKKLYRALTALLVVILAVCGAVILKNEQECRAGNRAYEVAARTAGLLEPPDTGPAPASPSAPQGQPEADPTRQTVSVATALIDFINGVSALGDVCNCLDDIQPGYVTAVSLSSPTVLTPVWRVSTDIGDYQLDTVTGGVTRVS